MDDRHKRCRDATIFKEDVFRRKKECLECDKRELHCNVI